MALSLKKITGGFTASAKVVDGSLILSLPDAVTPVVWRMELVHAKASAIEVREQDGGTYMLTLKTPKGDVNDIAAYTSRAKAVEALIAVSDAMENAHGQMAPAPMATVASDASPAQRTTRKQKGSSPAGSILTGIIGLALVIMLIGLLMKLNPMPTGIAPANADMTGIAAEGPSTAGQAMSADDFLRSR